MTPEKAIKFLDEEIVRLEGAPIINGCEMTDDWKEQLEICKLAKSALEKQIPKKVHRYDVNPSEKFCPNCGLSIENKGGYCAECGQALDWSETE